MTKILHRKFRKYSGPMIRGEGTLEIPSGAIETSHVHRAFYLTAKVETGAKFGSIVMYDGTAVTAGLDQHIAVYPRELANEDFNAKDDQGGLWKLLRRMEVIQDTHYNMLLSRLFGLLRSHNWYLAQDGVLRYYDDGSIANRAVAAGDTVFGFHIRAELTPAVGTVPKKGPFWEQSAEFAYAFHRVFGHPATRVTQTEFGMEHLVKRTKRRRLNMGTKKRPIWHNLEKSSYLTEVTALRVDEGQWSQPIDLAMSVYQSNSVNAPSIANKALARAIKRCRGSWEAIAKELIQNLGNNTYGRWDDDLKTGRYQRTRTAALQSKLWDRSLFIGSKAIMPKDLQG